MKTLFLFNQEPRKWHKAAKYSTQSRASSQKPSSSMAACQEWGRHAEEDLSDLIITCMGSKSVWMESGWERLKGVRPRHSSGYERQHVPGQSRRAANCQIKMTALVFWALTVMNRWTPTETTWHSSFNTLHISVLRWPMICRSLFCVYSCTFLHFVVKRFNLSFRCARFLTARLVLLLHQIVWFTFSPRVLTWIFCMCQELYWVTQKAIMLATATVIAD